MEEGVTKEGRKTVRLRAPAQVLLGRLAHPLHSLNSSLSLTHVSRAPRFGILTMSLVFCVLTL